MADGPDVRVVFEESLLAILEATAAAVRADRTDRAAPRAHHQTLLTRVRQLLAQLEQTAAAVLTEQIGRALRAGYRAAAADLAAVGLTEPPMIDLRVNTTATERLLRNAQQPVLLAVDVAYRRAIAAADDRAAQLHLDRLADRGIAGRDSTGRRWELADYVDVVIGDATRDASIDGYNRGLAAAALLLAESGAELGLETP